MSMKVNVKALLGTLLLLVLLPATSPGHELGTTRVSVRFDAAGYTAEIVTDAQSLVEKLAAMTEDSAVNGGGNSAGEAMSAAQLEQRLRELQVIA